MKREVESPSNHQDMAREADEKWCAFRAALAETPAAPVADELRAHIESLESQQPNTRGVWQE